MQKTSLSVAAGSGARAPEDVHDEDSRPAAGGCRRRQRRRPCLRFLQSAPLPAARTLPHAGFPAAKLPARMC